MTEMRGLGKGIRALIPEREPVQILPERQMSTELLRDLQKEGQIVRIPIQTIRPNRFQPRQAIDESKVHELADSIRKSGLIYPLIVRKEANSGLEKPFFEIVAGERRLRALSLIGETHVPAIVKEISDEKACQLSLIENLQREELNPIEQAQAYQRLIDEFHLTQEKISESVGKDRTTITNILRLLKLSPQVRQEVVEGRLTLGHARALLSLDSEKNQWILAQRVTAEGLSVRQVERLVKGSSRTLAHKAGTRDPHLVALEGKLQRSLGTKVEIVHRRGSRGWLRIAYYSLKDLDRLTSRFVGPSSNPLDH